VSKKKNDPQKVRALKQDRPILVEDGIKCPEHLARCAPVSSFFEPWQRYTPLRKNVTK
jgi:hypothetical protein